MALPIVGSDLQPILKFNAKSARWKIDDLLVSEVVMLVDMDAVQVGWLKFFEGTAPVFEMVTASALADGVSFLQMPTERGADGKLSFKRGFKAQVKLSNQIAAGRPSVREWTSNSLATCRGFDKLHDLWLAAKDRHPGHVPLVKSTGAEVMPGRAGDNYSPVLTIERWVPRPADFANGAGAVVAVGGGNFDDLDDDISDIPFDK